MKISGLRIGVFLLSLASAGLGLGPRAGKLQAAAPTAGWAIELTLSVSGQYRVTEKAGPISGDYSFKILWKGALEPDDVDWRLVHKTCDLLDWKAEEKPAPQSREETLTAMDFADKPAFHFRYVLRDEGQIEISFGTDGFPIPVGPSAHKFQLVLPSSAGTTQPGREPNYDQSVIKGSNRILILESDLGHDPLERTFAWSWGGTQSMLEQDATVVCRQTHQVLMRIVLSPLDR